MKVIFEMASNYLTLLKRNLWLIMFTMIGKELKKRSNFSLKQEILNFFSKKIKKSLTILKTCIIFATHF